MKGTWNRRIGLALMVLSLFSLTSGSSDGTSASLSPVRHLEASLAASEGQGTIVGMRAILSSGNDCVVFITCSPKIQNILLASTEPSQSDHPDELVVLDGIRLVFSQGDMLQSHTPRWTEMGFLSICGMTGFAADIQHLTRVVLRQVESHRALYSQDLPIDRIVKAFSETMQGVSLSDGGRPFGTQVLLAGMDAPATSKRAIGVFTLDPTGGWRNHRGGTATVGRFASEVQSLLLEKKKGAQLSPRDTMELCVDALLEATVKHGFKPDNDQVDGLILWTDEHGTFRRALIHPDDMNDSYRKCLSQFDS